MLSESKNESHRQEKDNEISLRSAHIAFDILSETYLDI